jgi:outer membrane scaffolding protein for murein synthesis (MipA/OmpV family)
MQKTSLGLFTLLGLFAADFAHADKPLWEAGAGIAALSFPDYRGADHRQEYVLPVPFFIYRGEILKADREGMRGMLMKEDNVEIQISLNGSVPVKSSNNSARTGMPDLPATFEIGPSLHLTLLGSAKEKSNLDLRLPLRPVFSIGAGGVHSVGWLFQPQLNLDLRDFAGLDGWHVGMLAGPIFGDAHYHQHFYGVDPAYATPDRPAYQARGGYAGAQFITGLSKRFPNYWVGAFVKFDTVNHAVFVDSPLVKAQSNFSAGFAVSWIFGASETMVKDDE